MKLFDLFISRRRPDVLFVGALVTTLVGTGCAGGRPPGHGPDACVSTGVVEVVVDYFHAFNRHDIEAMVALYHENAEVFAPDVVGPRRGRQAIRDAYLELFQLAPDVTDSILEIDASGSKVFVAFETRGTLALDLPAAGGRRDAKFGFPVFAVFEVRDNKIIRDTTYYDQSEFFRQISR